MFLHAQSLRVSVATFILALVAGCSSQDGVPGSGWHSEGTSSSGASSGSGSKGTGGTGSSGGNLGSASGSGGAASSSGAGGSSGASSGATGGSSSGGSATSITANTTWANGQQLTSNVTIAPGVTVTIAPGAVITIGSNVSIVVAGTLTASSASPSHATLTGLAWTGIVVNTGGTLTLDGVDVTGAATALQTNTGAANAEYDDATITGASMPFNVAAGTTLGVKHANVAGTKGSSRIAGTFNASYLDYDSNGNEGIVTMDPTANESIEDSKLHGSGPTGDMVVSSQGAASIHVAYTDITNVHCGFHFDTVTAFDVSYTNVESNSYGFMLYGSDGTGSRSVTYSNIDQNTVAYDTQGNNGPITFDHDYVTGTTNPGTAVSTTNGEVSTVAGTGPR